MKKLFLSITLGLLASLVFGGVALAVEQLDQEHAGPDQWVFLLTNRDEDGNYHFYGQSFQVGKTGQLSKISIPLAQSEGSAGYLQLSVYELSEFGVWELQTYVAKSADDVPDAKPDRSMPDTWTDFVFPANRRIDVVSGSTYMFAIEPLPGGAAYDWHYGDPNYTGGGLYQRRGSGNPAPGTGGYAPTDNTVDMLFRTYVDADAPDTTAPTGSVRINGGDATTTSRDVTLRLPSNDPIVDGQERSGVVEMKVKNENKTFAEMPWEPKTTPKAWRLSIGAGTKTVAVRYRDAAGNVSPTYSDSIIYRR